MSYDANDPKWTAYILDELDADERAAVEAEIAEDDNARDYVESLRAATSMLEEELMVSPEPAPKLDDIQRQRVVREAAKAKVTPRRNWALIGAGIAAAAGLVMFAYAERQGGKADEMALAEVSADQRMRRATVAMDEVSAEETPDEVSGLRYRAEQEKKQLADNARNAGYLGDLRAAPGAFDDSGAVYNAFDADGEESRGYIGADGVGSGTGKIDHNTEQYDHISENEFVAIADDPLSTFSIDVDTASYSNMRRFVNQNSLPPAGAVRLEEMINYFDYAYSPPTSDVPFAVHVDSTEAPWAPDHRLVRIGLKGREISSDQRPTHNLVFLIDVSGSMKAKNKLPLLQKSMNMLVDNLQAEDRIAIVTYAGSAGVVLESTSVRNKSKIKKAINKLRSGGSTNGAQGIERAYEIAIAQYASGGVNRVILATDGDFNVGTSNRSDLVDMIEKKAKSGVYLTVLGFGMGNLNDATLEQLADHGNGNYAYIDTQNEATKVLVTEIASTLVTIAKDVKIQVEFNPNQVASYRLIGYENRVLAHQDFNDDTKDAGEIGSGHTVTALYEIVLGQGSSSSSKVDDLKYQTSRQNSTAADSDEMLTVKLRYKDPDGDSSKLIERAFTDTGATMSNASAGMFLAASVAEFGMLLRNSEHKGTATYASAKKLAKTAAKTDPHGYRAELVELITAAAKAAK